MASARSVAALEAALAHAAGVEVELERPSEPEHGDYATNVALRLAPVRKRAPRDLAEEIARAAEALPAVERAEVAGPGFVNLFLADDWYREALVEIDDAGRGFGAGWVEQPERIQVEMVSANPTGPIHVAAARNGAYGDSVARLLEHAGHTVEREYYYNDAGRQMELFRESVEAVRRGEPPPEEGYHGDYIAEVARVEGDPVPRMLEQIERTLERFRVHFDSWVLQSEIENDLPRILERLDTYEKDGAVWVRSTAFGDEKDRVLIRSAERGGLPTYEAADAAYLEHKLGRGFDRVIYVLGADHHGVRGWYAVLAKMLGHDPERVEVLLYQLVHLVRSGGELAKVSKRRGDIVTLDEFIDEVGVDAARWYLVSRGHDQTIEIDVDLARERSEKNPVYYVQYAHARIAGILRNLDDAELGEDGPIEQQERELIKQLLEFPEVTYKAAERRAPHMLPEYAIRVADDFHRFYHHCRVIDEGSVHPFRRDLCLATQTVIASSLGLIGVEAPDRM